MRIYRPAIKKATPGKATYIGFRRMLTPSSVQVQLSTKTTSEQSKSRANSLLPRCTSASSLKSVQRLLKYTTSPQIIPVTPAERSKVASARKRRVIRRIKHSHAKRRHRTRMLIGTGLVFLYYCKSGGQISGSKNNTNPVATIRNGPVETLPSTKREPSSKTKPSWSLKRKGRDDDTQPSTKRRRLYRKGLGDWQKVLTSASERLQDVPPYPTMLPQTSTTPRNADQEPRFGGDWQKALTEASERLQAVPPYPTILSQRSDSSKRKRITIKLPVAAARNIVKNLAEKLPVAQVRDHVENLANKVPAMAQSVKNLADKLPVAEVRDQVRNLTNNITVVDSVKQTVQNLGEKVPVEAVGQIVKKWTELPLSSAYSHPILQQKEKQEQRQSL